MDFYRIGNFYWNSNWLFYWNLDQITKKGISCHKCKREIPKGDYRVVMDLGRMTRSGHPWRHLFCIECTYIELDLVKDYMEELKYRIEKKLIKFRTRQGENEDGEIN